MCGREYLYCYKGMGFEEHYWASKKEFVELFYVSFFFVQLPRGKF